MLNSVMRVTTIERISTLLLLITITLSGTFCLWNQDWIKLSEIYAKRDIIVVTSDNTKPVKLLNEILTSQVTLINNQHPATLGEECEKFTKTVIIVTNISLIENYEIHWACRNYKWQFTVLYLTEEPSAFANKEIIEEYTKQNLPELTDVFFGNNEIVYGLTCIQNNCISMDVKYYFKRSKSLLGSSLKFALVRNWENLEETYSDDVVNVYKTSQEINYELLTGIQILLNFSNVIFSATDWAILYDNGTWDGMAKLVDDRTVDVGLSRTYLLPYRVKHFRFLVVVKNERLIAYYHPAARVNTDILADDFDFRIWIILFLQTCLVAGLIKVLCNIDISKSLLIVIGTMSQRSSSHNIDVGSNNKHRIFSFLLNLSGLLFYAYFSALLVSTFSREAYVIKTIDDLFKLGYSFGILHDSYLIKEDAIALTPKNTALGQIIANLDPKLKLLSLDDASKAVIENDKFAFLSEVNLYSLFPNYVSGKEVCNGVKDVVIEEENIKSAAFVMKDSPYAEYLNFAYLTMWERGITARFWKIEAKDAMELKPSCKDSSKSKRGIVVDMGELKTAFLIPLIGFTLSVLALCLERKCNKTVSSFVQIKIICAIYSKFLKK